MAVVLFCSAGVTGITVLLRDDAATERLPVLEFDGLDSPLGNCVLDLACACALSHPSKSGSPPSSNDKAGAGAVMLISDGASKKDSSSISPHASSTSSCSSCAGLKSGSVEVLASAGAVGPTSAFRWSVEADEAE